MKLAKFAFIVSSAFALASCLDPQVETDTVTEEATLCASGVQAAPGAAVPAFVSWSGSLPGTGNVTAQAWIVMARTTNPQGMWALYRINVADRKVTWAATFKSSQRPAVFAALSISNTAVGGIRIPPGPIGPGGNDWLQANALVRAGYMTYYLGYL